MATQYLGVLWTHHLLAHGSWGELLIPVFDVAEASTDVNANDLLVLSAESGVNNPRLQQHFRATVTIGEGVSPLYQHDIRDEYGDFDIISTSDTQIYYMYLDGIATSQSVAAGYAYPAIIQFADGEAVFITGMIGRDDPNVVPPATWSYGSYAYTPFTVTNLSGTNAMTVGYLGDYLMGNNPIFDDDPLAEGGVNYGGQGGTGSFSETGDSILIPNLPSLSASDSGFVTLFNPSLSQLRNLASYMWSSAFDVESWQKIFADPMDAIIGLSIVPVAVPHANPREVKVGNIGTGVSMDVATQQYVELDCGSLDISEYWGAYLDYAPYTKADIYLPYCGTHPIDVDDIMGKTIKVVYHVDVLSGACCCYVKCGDSVLYTFIGQCSSSIPISANDWTNVINGVLSIAGSVGSMVATGGASAPLAVPALAATAVNGIKPAIEKSGSMSGTGGMMAVQTPYIILTRPLQAKPANQNRFMGYPSFVTTSLSALSGYTEVESIHLNYVTATEEELNEIVTLLKEGVVF